MMKLPFAYRLGAAFVTAVGIWLASFVFSIDGTVPYMLIVAVAVFFVPHLPLWCIFGVSIMSWGVADVVDLVIDPPQDVRDAHLAFLTEHSAEMVKTLSELGVPPDQRTGLLAIHMDSLERTYTLQLLFIATAMASALILFGLALVWLGLKRARVLRRRESQELVKLFQEAAKVVVERSEEANPVVDGKEEGQPVVEKSQPALLQLKRDWGVTIFSIGICLGAGCGAFYALLHDAKVWGWVCAILSLLTGIGAVYVEYTCSGCQKKDAVWGFDRSVQCPKCEQRHVVQWVKARA